jgi:thiamine-monophosphate kinase
VGDLGHLLDASKVGALLELAMIPRSVALGRQLAGSARDIALRCLLAGGDDYELCFTAAAARDPLVVALGAELGLELHRVGTIVADPGLVVRDSSGRPLPALPRAFDHFAA